LKNVPPRFTVKIQDGGMCIENYEFDNVFIRKVRGKWHKIVPVLGGGKHKIKRKSVCFWMDMGNISSRSDEILIFSLALRARENIKFHHYSMRYIPYPFKTNRYPLFIRHKYIKLFQNKLWFDHNCFLSFYHNWLTKFHQDTALTVI